MATPDPDLTALQSTLAGAVIVPGAPGYEAVRRPAMARFDDTRPAAVVRCESADDVAAALAFARRSGLRPAPRSGGHCFAGRSSTDGIVIDVSRMSAVTVEGDVATVGAGVRLGVLYDVLEEHGLTIPAGCGPEVGIAGLTLGGGLGILGRSHGLTCDSLLAARVVLADGRVVDCDEERDADLFWALRGAGGGQFGVVTSLVFRALPAPAANTFHLAWPYADAEAVIAAWQDWAPSAPDALDATLRLNAGQDPGRPPGVHVTGAMLGDEAGTVAQLDQLMESAGSDPAWIWYAHLPHRDAKRSLVGLGAPDEPGSETDAPADLFNTSEFFRRALPADAVAALVRNLGDGRTPGQSREVNFTPWGGAYNRVPAGATAFVHRAERFMVEHAAVVRRDAPAGARRDAREWMRRSWAIVHPWGSGGVYPNFPDPDLEDWGTAYHGANLERLRRVKRAYDPDRLFRFDQAL